MIPVIINNRDRLSTTKKLVEDLQRLEYTKVVIIDNASTYPPLLQWYDTLSSVIVYRYSNIGPRAIYDSGILNSFRTYPWIAYTDSDIELNPETPKGFIETLVNKAETWHYNKAGLALRVDDIQEDQLGYIMGSWEKPFWTRELEKDVFIADVDTTFCVIKPSVGFDYTAIRIAGNLTARHIPWYNKIGEMSAEELYYLENSSDDSTYKRFYRNSK